MLGIIQDWLSLFLRWAHIIAGIGWIGSSFYFMALDASLKRSSRSPEGVTGENWSVHGGGFYHIQKYAVAPEQMPADLHWFKWESYLTWLSGFALITVTYYWSASSYLIDRSVADIAPWQGVAISVAPVVQVGAEDQSSPDVRGAVRRYRRCRLGLRLRFLGPRDLPASGCDDRHHHDRQCLHGDHPKPAHRGGRP
jgi:hypothetical protein